jgi:hypothetical protein
MASGGFKTPLPFLPFSFGGGSIVPVNPVPTIPITANTLVSQLNIRGENNRVRDPGLTDRDFVKVLKLNAPRMFEALQNNADITDQRLRNLSEAFSFVGLVKDPAGNTTIVGATFTVRAGNQTFQLANGRLSYGVANTPPNDDDIQDNHVTAYIDEVANQLIFRFRYSDGTLKTGTVALV